MKKSVLILAGLALAISFLSLKLISQNAKSHVTGKIIDNASGTAVGFAYVTIKDSSNLINTISDEDGSFDLVNVTHVKEQPLNIALNNVVNPEQISQQVNENRVENLKIYANPGFMFKGLMCILNSF